MRFIAVLFLLAAFSNRGLAYLGNDDEAIDAMYGDIVKRHLRDDGTVSVLYHNKKYYCYVVFKDLHTISEAYARGNGGKLSDKEIAGFLKANAGRSHWPTTALSLEGKMERADHEAEASFTEIDGRLMLQVASKAK